MAESAGGYDYDFITEIPGDLICTLCHYPFQNPLQIEHCGHIFCKECYEQIKDHAETNNVELCCPLDRHIIDVTRVFNDKSDERKVLSLKVKCPNFSVGCTWTGELREALVHERTCCKNQTAVNNSFDMELKKIIKRMTELEVKVQCQEGKLEDKQKQLDFQTQVIENQKKQMENLQKHLDDKNKQIENQVANQKKQIESFKKKFENLDEQVEVQNNIIMDLKIKMENENKELENKGKDIDNSTNGTKEHENVIQKFESFLYKMIIPNGFDSSDYMPVCTAFQWKFNVDKVRSGERPFPRPPFYNTKNAMCFALVVAYVGNIFRIGLVRYRGKYDHATDEITKTTPFSFKVNIFGNNGNCKLLKFTNSKPDLRILPSQPFSTMSIVKAISNEEIDNFTVDGDVHLYCFFSDVTI